MNLTIMPNFTGNNDVKYKKAQQAPSFKKQEEVKLLKCLFEVAQIEKKIKLFEIFKSILGTLRLCGIETSKISKKSNKSIEYGLFGNSGKNIGRLKFSKDKALAHTRRIDFSNAENPDESFSLIKAKGDELTIVG